MGRIAVAMPGKMGDALYALYVARHIAYKYSEQVDFFTSSYCEPIRPLVEYQGFIDKMVVPHDYEIANMGCGIQPWHMPIPTGYRYSFQLGFRTTPAKFLGDWMADDAGVSLLYTALDTPQYPKPFHDYFTMCLRGSPDYTEFGRQFVALSPYPVIEVGGLTDNVANDSIDKTGLDFLTTAALIGNSSGYVGLMSAMLVVANGFPKLKKVAVHDGIHWDMRHVMRSENNFYPVKPTAEEVLSDIFNCHAG